MTTTTYGFAFLSLLLVGAIFGFFYAWVCSTMWGLDAIDPRVAIEAMQGMNASVRNAVFAPAFFGTPFALFVTGALAYGAGNRRAGRIFAVAGVLYLVGGLVLTMMVNVPMNEALAEVVVPTDVEAARAIWTEYSPRWQTFNIVRTCASGGALVLTGLGLVALGAKP
ncbi:DUF1772 domain-containing protein [Gymnodinialimonas hymeniacidonis]|uniref:anthrone oxygenase family protein n=1 Tax=Gymnodinialimonas hymeniacidonis TaxID=3126508 RepID=UPI0034C633AF